jgi:hypothetical protein
MTYAPGSFFYDAPLDAGRAGATLTCVSFAFDQEKRASPATHPAFERDQQRDEGVLGRFLACRPRRRKGRTARSECRGGSNWPRWIRIRGLRAGGHVVFLDLLKRRDRAHGA